MVPLLKGTFRGLQDPDSVPVRSMHLLSYEM